MNNGISESLSYDLAVARIKELENEVNKLNNIINELGKYIIHRKKISWDDNGAYDDILDKLKELKENKGE